MTNNNADLFACMSSAPKVTTTEVKVRPWDKVRNLTKNGYIDQHVNNGAAQVAKSTTAWDEPYADR